MLSAWNIGASFPAAKAGISQQLTDEKTKQRMAANFTAENNVVPLVGCTAESLVDEAYAHRAEWNFDNYAQALASRPFLIITSDDGLASAGHRFAAALEQAGDKRVTETHFPTDHSYSDHRIAVTTALLDWLAALK
jgi:hypothetical protein